jgi:hypothetical protein
MKIGKITVSAWNGVTFRIKPVRHYDLRNVWYWLWWGFGFWKDNTK